MAAVRFRYDVVGDGQALTRAHPHFLGREKWLENLCLNSFGNASPIILDRYHYKIIVLFRANRNDPFLAIWLDTSDGVGGIHDEVQDNLVDFAYVARNGG